MIQNLKKILAPIDFSEYSMEALRGAMELAKDLDVELHIVHVVAPHFSLFDKMREQARETLMVEEAEEELARIRKDDCGNSATVVTQVLVGPPVCGELLISVENQQFATHKLAIASAAES